MNHLNWELSVLSRAVQYTNLSTAAQNVGVSQPQLSRIIARVEKELEIVLLDRSVKRKSGWMPIAYKLSEVYSSSQRKLNSEIQRLQEEQRPTHFHIGCLEGLLELASQFSKHLVEASGIKLLELNVYELKDLEDQFYRGNLDLIFNFREPGKKKYKNRFEIGQQEFKEFKGSKAYIFSHYEYEAETIIKKRNLVKNTPIILSNSLMARRHLLNSYSGNGRLPGKVRYKSRGATSRQNLPVLIIGSDFLNEAVWRDILEFKPSER